MNAAASAAQKGGNTLDKNENKKDLAKDMEIERKALEEKFEIDRLVILDCKDLKFYRDDGNFISLKYKNEDYFNVRLTRLVPFFSKTTYISVAYDNKENEFVELGVIKDMSELPKDQFEMLDQYLEYKYYMPEIKKIFSIKDNNRGFIFVDIETSSGRKTICVRDWYSNFRMLSESLLYAVDVDGNKYFCPDIEKLDKKSLQILEIFV